MLQPDMFEVASRHIARVSFGDLAVGENAEDSLRKRGTVVTWIPLIGLCVLSSRVSPGDIHGRLSPLQNYLQLAICTHP